MTQQFKIYADQGGHKTRPYGWIAHIVSNRRGDPCGRALKQYFSSICFGSLSFLLLPF
ncbi:MAG: hypothetical protein RLZZ156_2720 [Deinococcota bacterium]|jgi:hypothetical protein